MLNTLFEQNDIDLTGSKLTLSFVSLLIQDIIDKNPKNGLLHDLIKLTGAKKIYEQAYNNAYDRLRDLIQNDAQFIHDMENFSYKDGFNDEYIAKLEKVADLAIKDITKNAEILVDQITI